MTRKLSQPADIREFRSHTSIHAMFLLLAICLVGCGPEAHQKTIMLTRKPISPVPETIRTLELGKPSDRPYDIVGKVGYWAVTNSMSWGKHTELIPLASEMGADGLLGIHTGAHPLTTVSYKWHWISAVAVKFLDPGQKPKHQSGSFMVGVLPCLAADGRTNNIVQQLARLWLENAGYYAVNHTQGVFDRDLKALEALPTEKLAGLCGTHTDLILLSEAAGKGSVNLGVAGSDKIQLTFQLYSKSQRKVVWQSSAVGSATMGAITRAMMDKWEVYVAAEEAFKSLKVVSGSKAVEFR